MKKRLQNQFKRCCDRSSRCRLAAEQALEPRPGGAQADIAGVGEVVDLGDLFFVAEVTGRQENHGIGRIVFDMEDFGVEPKLISGIYDMSTLLDKINLRTSDNDIFIYYKTPEFENSLYGESNDFNRFLKIVNILKKLRAL